MKQRATISIDAPYGYGKTYFITHLKKQLEGKKCTVLSINAWKTDWAPDPLIVIVDAILEAIKDQNKEESKVIKNLEKIANSVINQLPKVAGKILLGVSMNLIEKKY